MLTPKESQLLGLLQREGPLSRQDVHRRTGLRPNSVGKLVEQMMGARLLREGDPVSAGRGRPAVPLEIDGDSRTVLGIAIESRRVRTSTLNLHGIRLGMTVTKAAGAHDVIDVAAQVLKQVDHAPLLGVGVTVTGFADLQARQLLLSSAAPGQPRLSLAPLFDAAGDVPLRIANDLQALALHWAMTQPGTDSQDTLLVYLRDGAMGSAYLVNGELTHGCITGGNEIGHTRYPVDTERCYCGQTGCLERICSTGFYTAQPDHHPDAATLGAAIARFQGDDPALQRIIHHLGNGITNAINLLRPHRLILASEFNSYPMFTNRLIDHVRERALPALADRVRIDLWESHGVDFAQAAASLALARVFSARPEVDEAW